MIHTIDVTMTEGDEDVSYDMDVEYGILSHGITVIACFIEAIPYPTTEQFNVMDKAASSYARLFGANLISDFEIFLGDKQDKYSKENE